MLADIHNQEYFDESTVEGKVVKFMALYSDLTEVVAHGNGDLEKAMNEFVSPSLITFQNYDNFIEVVENASKSIPISHMQFWQSVINFTLIKF